MAITTMDKYREATREVGFRKRVYHRQVASGRMTRESAEQRIAIMEAIAADYEKLLQTEAGTDK